MKFYVVKAITNKTYVKTLGEYVELSTAETICDINKNNYDFAKSTINRCCCLESVPDVEFTIVEIDKEPMIGETAAVLRNDVEKNCKVSRTLDVWEEITEFIRDNSRKTMNSYEDYIDFYYDNTRVYSNMHDYFDGQFESSSASLVDYKNEIDELESAIESGDKKVLSNGEIIEII